VIADEYIIPKDAEAFYSERVLRMPLCYQPNDRERAIVAPRTRAEYGLPENALVFCCFTQAVKILPDVFARWMSLLSRVPESVLWILEDNVWASANLRREAGAAGVDPERIVAAARASNDEHLARFRAADIALDTFPYTSHTTASDALWMGCPLVALCGETFAARVSASIVSACGFPEFVTHTLDDYENLAYRLATDAPYLEDVRARLAAARETSPLFDSGKFARDLEAIYLDITQ
jgi:protein O-GlcNAc transferase